jgi:hypothetical protein
VRSVWSVIKPLARLAVSNAAAQLGLADMSHAVAVLTRCGVTKIPPGDVLLVVRPQSGRTLVGFHRESSSVAVA